MWLDEDTEAALEWAEWEASLCPSCREPSHECFADEDKTPGYEGVAVRCHSCAARDRAAEKFRDDGAQAHGLRFFSRRVT